MFGPFFPLSPIKIGYSKLADQGVIVYYPSANILLGQEVLEKAKKAAQTNRDFYRTSMEQKVLVVQSNFDFLRFGAYPEGGGAGTPFGVLVKESKATENILTHEMSHRYLSKISKVPLVFPRWFDEGLASYLGKMDYYRKSPSDLREDLRSGRYLENIIEWRGFRGMFNWYSMVFWHRNKNPRLLYGQSYQMAKYLFDKFGEEKVFQVINLTKQMPFKQAFVQTLSMTEEEFHQEFIRYIEGSRPENNLQP